jgi:hypothetical protein
MAPTLSVSYCHLNIIKHSQILGSHSGVDENQSLLGCDTVWTGNWFSVFHRIIPPSFSRVSSFHSLIILGNGCNMVLGQKPFIQKHSITSQETQILIRHSSDKVKADKEGPFHLYIQLFYVRNH